MRWDVRLGHRHSDVKLNDEEQALPNLWSLKGAGALDQKRPVAMIENNR